MAATRRIAYGRDAVTCDRLAHEPSVEFPIPDSLDGMCQQLKPQPLPPEVFAQGLWHVWRLSGEPGLAGAIDPGDVHERAPAFFETRPKATAFESLDNGVYTAYSYF